MTKTRKVTPDTRLRHELVAIAAALSALAESPGPLDSKRLGDLFYRVAIAVGECDTIARTPKPKPKRKGATPTNGELCSTQDR